MARQVAHLHLKLDFSNLLFSPSAMSNSFANPWTVAHEAPLSIEFSKQEHWSGLPCIPPGELPNPQVEPASLTLGRQTLYHWATCKAPLKLKEATNHLNILLKCGFSFCEVWAGTLDSVFPAGCQEIFVLHLDHLILGQEFNTLSPNPTSPRSQLRTTILDKHRSDQQQELYCEHERVETDSGPLLP